MGQFSYMDSSLADIVMAAQVIVVGKLKAQGALKKSVTIPSNPPHNFEYSSDQVEVRNRTRLSNEEIPLSPPNCLRLDFGSA